MALRRGHTVLIVTTGVPQLRPEIAASWRRSSLAGLHHEAMLEAVVSDVDSSSRLMQAAAPVLKELAQQFEGFEVGTLLADRSATLVARCFGTAELARDVDRLGAVPGVDFSEARSGTNAIATPFETRSALFVSTDEHFLADMRHYFCFGVPILHPVTQRVEGVIDIMATDETSPALMRSVIIRAARDIHQELIESYDVNVMAVFAAFNALRRTATDAVVMISDDIVLNNRHAVDILAPEDYVALRSIALDRPGFAGTLEMSLSSGATASVKVTDMGDPPAVVFQLRRAGEVIPVIPRGASTGRALSELDRAIADARRGAGHVFVKGEAGSGKTWVAGQLTKDADAVVLDGCDLIGVGVEEWLARLDRVVGLGPAATVVIDNVDLLPKSVTAYLARSLRTPDACRIVLTANANPEDSSGLEYLQSLCASMVVIPPLRERGAEFDLLVRSIIRDIKPTSDVRLTLSALDALGGHGWPGNVAELARMLEGALAKRSAGDITVNDLPGQFHAPRPRRGLTKLQQAERDAIESALKSCRNNKVHAATQLGISRSTLYARIREYGLG